MHIFISVTVIAIMSRHHMAMVPGTIYRSIHLSIHSVSEPACPVQHHRGAKAYPSSHTISCAIFSRGLYPGLLVSFLLISHLAGALGY